MPVVTLTSDFGLRDYYVSMIKGALLCNDPSLLLIDITHNINHYDIVQGAFIFKNAWPSFPKGTIHLLSINNFHSSNHHFLAIHHQEHYFIGPDNGIFSLVFEEFPRDVYSLQPPAGHPFPLKDLFAGAVQHISAGRPLHELGAQVEAPIQRITFQPVITPSRIRGAVIHIDNYENVVVNITRQLFEQVGLNRPFSLIFKRHDPITRLSNNYYDVPIGEPLCLFNSAGYIEIAINTGKASTLLGLNLEDTVQIDFHNE